MDLLPFDDAAALAPAHVVKEDLPGGGFVLRSPEALQPFARSIGSWLEHWARMTPLSPFLAERRADGSWRRLTYGEARQQVGCIAQALLNLDLPPHKPVV